MARGPHRSAQGALAARRRHRQRQRASLPAMRASHVAATARRTPFAVHAGTGSWPSADRDREHDSSSLDEDPFPAPSGIARVAVGMAAPGDRGRGGGVVTVSPLDHLGISLDAARPKHSSRARPSRSRRDRCHT